MKNDFGKELSTLLNARFTLIIIVSSEETRLIETIKEMCSQNKRSCISWDLGCGFKSLTSEKITIPPAPTPIAALEQMEKLEQEAVFVLKDFDECWSNPQVKRQLRNLAQNFKQSRKSIIVSTASPKIPEQLKDDSFITEFPLPETEEIELELEKVAAAPGARLNLSPLGRQKILQAALGLTASQALRVFSKAIVKDRVLDDRHIDMVTEEKRQVIRESQALEFYPLSQSLEEVGGLGLLKEWLRLRQRAFSKEARDFMLPAPKGIALIGIPGTGKSLTAKQLLHIGKCPCSSLMPEHCSAAWSANRKKEPEKLSSFQKQLLPVFSGSTKSRRHFHQAIKTAAPASAFLPRS